MKQLLGCMAKALPLLAQKCFAGITSLVAYSNLQEVWKEEHVKHTVNVMRASLVLLTLLPENAHGSVRFLSTSIRADADAAVEPLPSSRAAVAA